MASASDEQARRAAAAVARRSYGKLVALLAVRARDVDLAEEALSDAFLAALSTWPQRGCPDKPEAWLLTAARRKLVDVARRRQTRERAEPDVLLLADELAAVEAGLPDHRLALLFACAHPAIDVSIRAPLMLQVVLGLDAAAVGSAFLVSPAAMGQLLSRAKSKLRTAGIPFVVPERVELPGRLAAVLDAVYAAFAEGWTDAAGTDVARRDLADEALFLGRLVVELLPEEPEALGLLALMLHAEARRPARRGAGGVFVPLERHDVMLWDDAMIAEAEALLRRASACGAIGRYQLEAAVQSAHVAHRRSGTKDAAGLVVLYDALLALTSSPVVAINRALAVADAAGAAAALASLNELAADPRLASYQPFAVARAELLARTGAHDDARAAYDVAVGLEKDPAVRRFLLERRALVGAS